MKPAEFAVCFADPDTGEPILSTETREHLYDAAELLEDQIAEDLRNLDGMMRRDPEIDVWQSLNWLQDYLPPMYAASYDYGFIRDFHVCVLTVIYKLAVPWAGLASVAEQLAMNAILRSAEAQIAVKSDMGEDTSDIDVSDLWDLAFDDLDFEILFKPELDGLHNSEIGVEMGMINLDRQDWFNPLDTALTPSHPLTWRRINEGLNGRDEQQ